MKSNLVSIITPTFNSEKYISQTIQSIQAQTYNNWELLITDDCSTDGTIDVIKSYQKRDSRIKLFFSETNLGAGAARNRSIKEARGRYIAFCDSDDQWKKNKLEKQLSFIKENNLLFSYTDYDVVTEKNQFVKRIKCPKRLTYSRLLKNNYVGCLTVIYDKEKLGKVYMPLIRKRQDWLLWLQIMSKIKQTKGLNDSLSIYLIRSSSISNNKLSLINYSWKVYRQELKFSFFASLIYLTQFLLFYTLKRFK
jgi:teichuronic acid biosynthesis glycosyltransferase TuaG|tara:strand:- start:1215 stop:1967 length:753 start_codon:yes stop_codon:yes gene_type:complete